MSAKNVVVLVQARLGSSRFPRKMLEQLGDYSLIEWVLLRLKKSKRISEVVLTTTNNPIDDELEHLASQMDVLVFRGSENDVLGRFAEAAKCHQAQIIVRVCADNPFIDPAEVDNLVDFYFNSNCDYACNHQDRLGSGFSDGFGAEILSVDLLFKLDNEVHDIKYREHVTLFLWDNFNQFKLCAPKAPIDLNYPKLKFDVDTQSDLDYLKKLVSNNVNINSSSNEIIDIALKCDNN